MRVLRRLLFTAALTLGLPACDDDHGHGPVARDVSARMGDPVPYATAEQLATFERGREVALRRFDLGDGLGPAFNVTFCASCHERPVVGGSAGLYRNFFLGGTRTSDGVFFPGTSAGMSGGVTRLYYYGDEHPARPAVPEETNVTAVRNPIPFFGVGLIAEIPEREILRRADPDDADGDGISGRPNYDRGFVGRFGRKSQTVSIEGFIRGPLFNHLGVTTNPLTDEQRSRLPVDSSGGSERGTTAAWVAESLSRFAQAAAPSEPNMDDDGVPDPEMSTEDLFDLVSFAMLLAAPQLEELDEVGERGRRVFDRIGCDDCHTPRLEGPRGPLPVFSDLLLHDMGPELADGLEQGVATGSEFRTQPLWGLAAVGPYLHDGRATTIEQAIEMHAGEGEAARERYAALDAADREALGEFLRSLGGRDQLSPGLIAPDEPAPTDDDYGGPRAGLDAVERVRFAWGRAMFDRDMGFTEGAGQPRFNGDSCRACHFEPTVGGAGPRGVNVIRHGILNAAGEFTVPAAGTILHRSSRLFENPNRPQSEANVFELRQTPSLFGLGLVETIPVEAILANADPDDGDGDGISGRPSWTDGGRLGRFGWKAQVPTLAEFARDAATAELGLTVPYAAGHTFGQLHDNDDVPDPELSAEQLGRLVDYMTMLAPPPRRPPTDRAAAARGEEQFESLGCAGCHVPSLEGAAGPVAAYSDFLLHEILPEGAAGVEDASAGVREMRTAPLWGISVTAPYLHSGAADTLDQAVRAHDGEAAAVREAYEAASEEDRAALLAFLETL